MSEYEDYILQYFPDKDGKLETNKPRECRLCWIRNGYPSYTELEKICNSTYKTIMTYSSRFNWGAIRQKATDLQAKAEVDAEEQYKKDKLAKWDSVNETLLDSLMKEFEKVKKELENPNLTDEEKQLLVKRMLDISKEIRSLQPNSLRTANLPGTLNDKQDHKHSGEIEFSVRMKKFLSPDNIKKTET
jgi:hypothetical protein